MGRTSELYIQLREARRDPVPRSGERESAMLNALAPAERNREKPERPEYKCIPALSKRKHRKDEALFGKAVE